MNTLKILLVYGLESSYSNYLYNLKGKLLGDIEFVLCDIESDNPDRQRYSKASCNE